MKKTLSVKFVALLVIVSLSVAACAPAAAPQTGSVRVLAVETFLADIARNVAGERVIVESLIPMGMDPHTFSPTPQDVRIVSESDVLILNGAGFESWAEDMLANAGGERLVIEASAGLTSRQGREGEAAELSPEDMAGVICAELEGKTPEEEIATGADAASAADIHADEAANDAHAHTHGAELLLARLQALAGGFGGFIAFDVDEEGDYLIASGGGTIALTDASGAEVPVEETLPMDCAGLHSGALFDLAPGAYVIALGGLESDSTPFLAGAAEGHAHHGEGDPHFWLDPTLVVKYVENIRDGLIHVDPEGAAVYTQNAAAYIAQLNELHTWIEAQVAQVPAEKRVMVTDHDTFGYFADRYGFTVVGVIVPGFSTGASPSAQQLARLIDVVKETGAPAIFVETIASTQLAEQVAAETNARVVSNLYTHSITAPDGPAPTYIDMMRHNVNAIVEALK